MSEFEFDWYDAEFEFDYWYDAFPDGDKVENIPFLFDNREDEHENRIDDHDNPDNHGQQNMPEEAHGVMQPDYSVEECVTLQFAHLRKFSYENRFYFVTTFLLREGVLDELSVDTLMKIDHNKLQKLRRILTEKYLNIIWNDIRARNITDEYGNPITIYMSAMEASFLYPLELCNPSLLTYWQCAYDFHTKSFETSTLEDRLVKNRPLNCR